MRFRNFINAFLESEGVSPEAYFSDSQWKVRTDAGEQVFFARELEQIRAKIYEVPYAEFKGRRLVPIDNSIDPGAESLTYTWYDRVGEADFITDFTKALPRADVFGGQVTSYVRHIGLAYAWNVQELRAAAFARKPLPTMKAQACRQGVEQKIDIGLLLGYTNALGLTFKGLFTLSSTETYTVPNGVAGSPLWSLKTPREIKADLHALGRQVYVNSKEIETIDTLCLETNLHGLVSTKPMGDGDNRTILTAFLADDPYIRSMSQVETSPKLLSNSGWSGVRTVGYRKSPDVMQGVIPLEFTQMAPQWAGFEAVTNCEARVGGVQCYRPKAVIYADGFA